jgi:hypothetical protein
MVRAPGASVLEPAWSLMDLRIRVTRSRFSADWRSGITGETMSCKAVRDVPSGILDVVVSLSDTKQTVYSKHTSYKHWEGVV